MEVRMEYLFIVLFRDTRKNAAYVLLNDRISTE